MARSSVLSSAVRVEPRKAERESAAEVARAVGDQTRSLTLQLPDGSSVLLPRALVEVLRASAGEMADGHAVTVLASEVSLTPAEVAELLGLSKRSPESASQITTAIREFFGEQGRAPRVRPPRR